MKQYKRIMDIKDPTFDSLEMLCNIEAEDGWRIITISDGSIHRYATLEKDITDGSKQNSERSGLQIVSPTAASGNAVVKRGTQSNKTSTKG